MSAEHPTTTDRRRDPPGLPRRRAARRHPGPGREGPARLGRAAGPARGRPPEPGRGRPAQPGRDLAAGPADLPEPPAARQPPARRPRPRPRRLPPVPHRGRRVPLLPGQPRRPQGQGRARLHRRPDPARTGSSSRAGTCWGTRGGGERRLRSDRPSDFVGPRSARSRGPTLRRVGPDGLAVLVEQAQSLGVAGSGGSLASFRAWTLLAGLAGQLGPGFEVAGASGKVGPGAGR